MTVDRKTVFAERLRRQRLLEPITATEGYSSLFRGLQPVSPVYFSYPGSPPSLAHRTEFDDQVVCAQWRETRKIVKGRFLRGTIGYVFSEDLQLYANAFQRPMERLSHTQELVYDTLIHTGPLTPRQIKEETGLLNKEIMPALHRLQEAFLVYEDQLETDWERPWYVFAKEWPNVSVSPELCEAAAREVLRRFISGHVFVTLENTRDWSGWPVRDIKHLLQSLEADGRITACSIDGLGDGWMRIEDADLDPVEPPRSVFMLDRADPIVRASISELSRRFTGPVLQYLLIDGDFQGTVWGHWRIRPYDVDDIVLTIPEDERKERKATILQAVAWRYHPPNHSILRYDGETV